MADSQMGAPNLSFTNSLKAISGMGGTSSNLGVVANYGSVAALRGRLNAVNAGYYTTAKLDQMTVNDMVFAVRSIDDRTTIGDYMPVSTA